MTHIGEGDGLAGQSLYIFPLCKFRFPEKVTHSNFIKTTQPNVGNVIFDIL